MKKARKEEAEEEIKVMIEGVCSLCVISCVTQEGR